MKATEETEAIERNKWRTEAGCKGCRFLLGGYCERLGGFTQVGTKAGDFEQTPEGGGPRQVTGTCAARRV